MSYLFRASPQGWPLALVSDSHDGDAPPGHVAFATLDEMVAWKDENPDKRPPDPVVPPERPVSVAKWAFLLIIWRLGKEAALNAALAAYRGPDADRVRAKWAASDRIERDGATVDEIGAAMGMTPPEVDQVFRDAAKEENA